jgi:hypothetical protein
MRSFVEAWVEIVLGEAHPLPAGTAGKKFSGQFVVRVAPELQESLAQSAGPR